MALTEHECLHTEDLKNIAKDQRELRKSIAEIREKLFNGLCEKVDLIPSLEKTIDDIQRTLLLRGSDKSIMKKRGVDAAVIGVIVAVVSQWDKIAEFVQRFF